MTETSYDVLCPECEEAQGDLWDYDWGSREELVASCGECGADYILMRHVSVDYEAKKLSPKRSDATDRK